MQALAEPFLENMKNYLRKKRSAFGLEAKKAKDGLLP
jgi:hypothetical protein